MKPFQHTILGQVLCGGSILGIAATGGGKSECFILPALLLPGITIVISPLKSLMQDQFDQRLRQRYGVDDLATFINGDVELSEREQRLHRMEQGLYKLIYMTPEQLTRGYILESLQLANQQVGIRYLALDEAHCISQWGHDFRPAYLNLLARLERYDIHPVRIALTATASPNVRADICKELGFKNEPLEDGEGGHVLLVSSNRPELNLIVRITSTAEEKGEMIAGQIDRLLENNRRQGDKQKSGAAIIFMPHTGHRGEWGAEKTLPEAEKDGFKGKPPDDKAGMKSAGVEGFASYLERRLKQEVSIYHGKMEDESEDDAEDASDAQDQPELGDLTGRRRQIEQRKFISGDSDVMVATKGFGMGIDKPNIRLVIHRTAPGNLESYVQEAGRAGRDGATADALLLYAPAPTQPIEHEQSDRQIQEYFLNQRYIRREDVVVMRAFLKTLTPHLPGFYTFTSDEAIRYLETSKVFSWPEWKDPLRLSGTWSGEHREIRERGYEYEQKRDYAGRILAVLYRIRPDMHSETNVPFLRSEQQVKSLVHITKPADAKAIWDSNFYFRRELHERLTSADELAHWIGIQGDVSLATLSQQFKIPMAEVSALLTDIRRAQGKFTKGKDGKKKWDGRLLDFWATAPRNPTEDRAWLAWAGASSRVRKSLAEDNAKKAHRPIVNGKQQTETEDWFPRQVHAKPLAWEVEVGEGFTNDTEFDAYLDAFMRIHDERERNDWAAYQRLLSDYIGVKAEKEGRITQREQNCLRQIMLGYLKTGEVIKGGNCKSCSVCVPDGDFGQYSIEDRIDVIASIDHQVEFWLDDIENKPDSLPAARRLNDLFRRIVADRDKERGTDVYVLAWCARVLQEQPGHVGALWVRTQGAVRGVFSLSSTELLNNLESLQGRVLEEGPERLLALAEECRAVPAIDTNALDLLCAALTAVLGQRKKTLDLLTSVYENREATQAQRFKAAAQGFTLTDAEGRFPDDKRHRAYGFNAGKLSASWEDAYHFLSPFALRASWEQIYPVAQPLDELPAAALYVRWLVEQADRTEGYNKVMDVHPELWRFIPENERESLLQQIGIEALAASRANFIRLQEELHASEDESTGTLLIGEWLQYLSQRDDPSRFDQELCALDKVVPIAWQRLSDGHVELVLQNTHASGLLSDKLTSADALLQRLRALTKAKFVIDPNQWILTAFSSDASVEHFVGHVEDLTRRFPALTHLLSPTLLANALRIRNWKTVSGATLLDTAHIFESIGMIPLAVELELMAAARGVPIPPQQLVNDIQEVMSRPTANRVFETEYRESNALFQQAWRAARPQNLAELANWLQLFTSDAILRDEQATNHVAALIVRELESSSSRFSQRIESRLVREPLSSMVAALRRRAAWWTTIDAHWEVVFPTVLDKRLDELTQAYQDGLLSAEAVEEIMISRLNQPQREIPSSLIEALSAYSDLRDFRHLSALGRFVMFLGSASKELPNYEQQVSGSTFRKLARWVEQKHSPEQANFAVHLIEYLQKAGRFPATFLTPVSCNVQMLCAAGRHEDAIWLAAKHDQLTVGEIDADEFIERSVKDFHQSPASNELGDLYDRLLVVILPYVGKALR